MINQQLLDFIKNQTGNNVSKEDIYKQLKDNGWKEEDINKGFKSINNISLNIPVPPEEKVKNKKKLRKKIFIIIFIIALISLAGVEITNYFEYRTEKTKWDSEEHCQDMTIPMPCFGPQYQLVVVSLFYKIFPTADPNYGISYKPVIYLYPTQIENVKVELDYQGELIADYPTYDYSIKGWNVTAYPDGKIINNYGEEYSYLFWEGEPSIDVDYDLSTGFVVKGEDTIEFLQSTLSKMGLTPKEYNEFIVYWYPKMKDNKYNLIHFAGNEYTELAKLKIIPTPDSLLRVFMVYKSLDKEITIKPQEIASFERNGFTVVEWGGTELN